MLLMMLSVAGCASPVQLLSGGDRAISDRLYCGRAMPGGESVDAEAWDAFLRDVVTPAFPDGLTTWHGNGQWRDQQGDVLHEETFILELIHPPGSAADERVAAIIDEYIRRFRQESVLWVRSEIFVRFHMR